MTEPTNKGGRGKSRFKYFEITEDDKPLLEKLSEEHRAVLTTAGPYATIATALNLPEGTVKSRIHRARSAIIAMRQNQPETV